MADVSDDAKITSHLDQRLKCLPITLDHDYVLLNSVMGFFFPRYIVFCLVLNYLVVLVSV